MRYKIENFSYDSDTSVIVKNNQELRLTKLQKKLFDYFLAHSKQIINKETLMQQVWGRVVTDNTINKFVSALRNYIEDNPTNPKIIITHFGHGLSFEGKIKTQDNTVKNNANNIKLILVFLIIVLTIFIVVNTPFFEKIGEQKIFILKQNQHVLILPTEYHDSDLTLLQKNGLDEFLKTTINQTDSEGQVVFNPAKLNNRQSIEKYWHVDNKLIVLQTQVMKNGDIYESVIKLSQGANILAESKLFHGDVNSLMRAQINQISQLKGAVTTINTLPVLDDIFIQALGYKKTGQFAKAKALLLQALDKQDSNYQARFELAKILIEEQNYTESLSQLKTLKAMIAYQSIGTEIELAIAKIHYIQHDYELLIDELKNFYISHTTISAVKKAKIKLHIADAYLALGDLQNAMKFYKQSLVSIDSNFNPTLFAKSFYGQSQVLLHNSNNEDVYNYLEKALEYAITAGDLDQQVLALDEMAKMLLVSNQWEKGIALKKQAIEIMELSNDKGKVAGGLGTLAAFLIQSGHFSEAKKINDRLGDISKEIDNDTLYLNYLHYDAVLLLNIFKFEEASLQIDKQLQLAQSSKNLGMQLDNAFLEFELRLARKDTHDFKLEWDLRSQMIKELGFGRYQVYMDLYLARYYKQINDLEEAISIITKISEHAKLNNDIKILVDAQNQLAEIHIESDPVKALKILANIEQYKPDANPYLELKALALNKAGQTIEALNTLNQAKLVFHEAWKAENQLLLEQLEKAVK